jgi:hypothetical protein
VEADARNSFAERGFEEPPVLPCGGNRRQVGA